MAKRKELAKPSQADKLLAERSANVAELETDSFKKVSVLLAHKYADTNMKTAVLNLLLSTITCQDTVALILSGISFLSAHVCWVNAIQPSCILA